MHNPLFAAGQVKIGDAEFLGVPAQFLNHRVCQGVGEGFLTLIGRDNVIDRGKGSVWILHRQPAIPEHPESLRAGHLMNEVRPDEQLGLTIG